MRLALIALGLLATISFARADVAPPTIDAWSATKLLAGHWHSDMNGAVIDEVWLDNKANLITGMRRTVRGLSNEYQFMRIEKRKRGVYLITQPQGGKTTTYKLARWRPDFLEFTSQKKPWPRSFTYHLVFEDRLEGSDSIYSKGNYHVENFTWGLVK